VLPSAGPERLVTEGAIFLNAVLCSMLVLLLPRYGDIASFEPSAKRFRPRLRRAASLGIAGFLLTTATDWGIVCALRRSLREECQAAYPLWCPGNGN